jgi:hypothetical protein
MAVQSAFAVETFFFNNDSVIATQRIFRRHFNIGRHGKVPDRNTIKNWVEKFRTTTSATNKKTCRRCQNCADTGKHWKVTSRYRSQPKRSARRHSVALSMSSRSLRRLGLLHSNLHYHPYKIQTVQQLSDRDFTSRRAFCEQFVTLSELTSRCYSLRDNVRWNSFWIVRLCEETKHGILEWS